MRLRSDAPEVRAPAVAGAFYPGDPGTLSRLVEGCLDAADALEARATAGRPVERGTVSGILVPHAGLVYSGIVAAAAWRRLTVDPPGTVVLLGTNHGAGWLDGVGAWETGRWATPLGAVDVDDGLAAAIVALGPPFAVDRAAHLVEHSLEVQLPFLRRLMPGTRIVPLAVSAGTGRRAIEAGAALGRLLRERRVAGDKIVLAISTDAAHYPPASLGEAVNERLRPAIEAVDAAALAREEAAIVDERGPGLVCGMCGVQPTVLGLAALHAMGVTAGRVVAAATSADAGADTEQTVGYLAAVFA